MPDDGMTLTGRPVLHRGWGRPEGPRRGSCLGESGKRQEYDTSAPLHGRDGNYTRDVQHATYSTRSASGSTLRKGSCWEEYLMATAKKKTAKKKTAAKKPAAKKSAAKKK